MSEIEITIFNQKLKLSYQDNEKQRLINAVETLNNSWSKFSHLYGKVTDLKIITLISLELQDSLDGMHALKDNEAQLVNKIELLQKQEVILALSCNMLVGTQEKNMRLAQSQT